MDRDIVNALHVLYQSGPIAEQELLGSLWCGADSGPDLRDLTEKRGANLELNPHLIKFIKAVEQQIGNLPKPDFIFGFPLSQQPRSKGTSRPAFIAMPYGPEWFAKVRDIVVEIATSCRFELEVSKDLSTPGLITDQIWQGIRRAEVLVADITGTNPNVFYELGLAHALGKEVILLSQSREPPPFDISIARLLHYDLDSLDALRVALVSAFSSVPARYAFEGPQAYY